MWLCKHPVVMQTSCGYVNMANRNRAVKRFVQCKLQVFPHLEPVWTALWLDLLASDGHIEKGCIPPQVGVCGCRNFHQFVFFIHNFGYRYARKPFKGSEDADFGLVSEKNDWLAQGQVKMAKKTQKHPTCDAIPRNPQIQNEKQICSLRLCWMRRGFEQLSSSIAWWVIELQTFKKLQKKWRTRDLKGFEQ